MDHEQVHVRLSPCTEELVGAGMHSISAFTFHGPPRRTRRDSWPMTSSVRIES